MWLDEDAEEAIALLDYRNSLCPNCSQVRAESQAVGENGRPLHKYVAHSDQCMGCLAVAIASDDLSEARHPHTYFFRVDKIQ